MAQDSSSCCWKGSGGATGTLNMQSSQKPRILAVRELSLVSKSLIFRTCVPAVLLLRWFVNGQVTSFPNNRYMLTVWTTGVPQAMLVAQQHTQTSGDTHVPLPVPLAFYLRDADKSLPFTMANTSPFSSFTLQGKAQQPSCILLSGIIIIQPVKC